jgi:DNA phosphorothioation-associated putative methyltransferase
MRTSSSFIVTSPKVSYLSYPEFESDPHPPLAFALTVHLQTFRVKSRDNRNRHDVPILHRKELLVSPDHPLHEKFARLTRIEVARGLYEASRQIGTREGWNRVLQSKGLRLRGHRLLLGERTRSTAEGFLERIQGQVESARAADSVCSLPRLRGREFCG